MARDGDGPGSPFARPAFIASAVFLAAVLAGGAWLALGPRPGAPAPAPPASAPAAPAAGPASSDPAAASDSACGLPAGDQEPPDSALGPATVRVGDGLAVPSVQGVGPGVTAGGVSRCFAHSPTGAVVAAANFIVWLSSNQRLDEVTTTLIAAGADRDRMLAEVRSSWDGSTSPAFAVVGYKVEVRSPDEALVTIAASPASDRSRAVAWPLVMVWADGDWKVKPPSNGRWGQTAVTGVSGFIPWGS